MKFISLLFGFSGRITRRQWWHGHLFWLGAIFALVFFSGLTNLLAWLPRDASRAAYQFTLATGLPILVSTATMHARRLADCGIPPVLGYIHAILVGVSVAMNPLEGIEASQQLSVLRSAIEWVAAIAALPLFLVNAFLPGTIGDNAYGPDPLLPDLAPTT